MNSRSCYLLLLLSQPLRIFVILGLVFFVAGCSAPVEIMNAESAASRLEDAWQRAVSERLMQWSLETEAAWDRELSLILKSQIELNSVDGKVDVDWTIDMLSKQSQAREDNKRRLDAERDADQKSLAAWAEARKLRAAIRRWMQAGQTAEQREEIYKLITEEVAK